MKPAVLKKTAQVTVMMLVISILLPVLAFAASGFKDVKYENGTVTGTVYSDVYSVNSQVYMYSPSGSQLAVTNVTYSVYDGVYNYKFTYSGLGNYDYINLKGPVGTSVYGQVTDSVYKAVYRTIPPVTGGGGFGGGFGGGGASNSASESITVYADGTVNADQLKNSLEKYDTVTLNLNGDFVLIPAKALVNYVSNTKKVLKIVNSNGTYNLPLNVLKLDNLAGKLNVTVDELIIKASISKADEATASAVNAAATAIGGTMASAAVDFNITAIGKDDNKVAVDFGNSYISRVLPLTKAVNSGKATAVLYDPTTKKLSFVPAVFSDKEAVIKRNGSSIYAVIETNKSFGDITGHWAQNNITLLANKLVIEGVTDKTFEPERNITRAEFAALVVRSLGLSTSVSNATYATFKDVASGAWYAGVVGAAANAKLIDGYEDGTFKPDATINREELAAMVVRALNYAGAKPTVTSEEQAKLLAKFKDSNSIVWAKSEIATAIKAGIVDGMTDDTLGARSTATRAQSATMLKRLLTTANFIN